jgi:hypothetical protein
MVVRGAVVKRPEQDGRPGGAGRSPGGIVWGIVDRPPGACFKTRPLVDRNELVFPSFSAAESS